jgi:hypothetical protein
MNHSVENVTNCKIFITFSFLNMCLKIKFLSSVFFLVVQKNIFMNNILDSLSVTEHFSLHFMEEAVMISSCILVRIWEHVTPAWLSRRLFLDQSFKVFVF